jgi:dCMP deaminase
MSEKWDRRFLDMAHTIASWSKDPSTKVGAVIVNQRHRLVSVGYNGFPAEVEDTDERYDNRELKYKMVVHAERNAIDNAERSVDGCTIYTTLPPCCTCAGGIITKGIKEVVTVKSDNPRWAADFEISKRMFHEAGVIYRELEWKS